MSFAAESFRAPGLRAAHNFAMSAVAEIAPDLRKHFGNCDYSTKTSERDWVTTWDEKAEETIKKILGKFSTSVGFLSEETGGEGSPEVFWTIDGIDGTSNFVRGNHGCTTMLSLVDHDVPVVSVIHDIVDNDTYSAVAGQGAFKNRVAPIRVSERPIGQSYIEVYCDENNEHGRALHREIEATGAYLLRTSAAGATMTSVARGGTEGFVSLRNPFATPWDIAPGALLIHEAGGIVRNVGAEDYRLSNTDFIASNQVVFGALAAIAERNQETYATRAA